jgi:hypothetical protein
MTRWVEKVCTDHAVAAGYLHGKQLGLKGRALLEYASDTGARVQGLNNMENLPGILSSRDLKATIPLQTFYLEAFNNVRDLIEGTGPHHGVSKKVRATRFCKLLGCMYAANLLTQAILGRSTWGPESFIPFGSALGAFLGVPEEGGRYGSYLPTIGQFIFRDLRKAVRDVVYYDNWDSAWKLVFRYRVPGGTPLWKAIQGVRTMSGGGQVRDVSGKLLFTIPKEHTVRAITTGPYGTPEGQKYIQVEDAESIQKSLRDRAAEKLLGKKPKRKLTRHRRSRGD